MGRKRFAEYTWTMLFQKLMHFGNAEFSIRQINSKKGRSKKAMKGDFM